ncbi:MAG: hypothetical protein IM613_10105, partial [Cytophagales bacterium]|nr:hypothetical protein [Cytophagales bacterium]
CHQRLAICSGWLLKTYLSTVTKRNSEDETFYPRVTQPLQIAFVGGWHFYTTLFKNTFLRLEKSPKK